MKCRLILVQAPYLEPERVMLLFSVLAVAEILIQNSWNSNGMVKWKEHDFGVLKT